MTVRRVEPLPRDRGLGVEPLVEDPRDDLEHRAPEPRAAGGAGREHDAVFVQCQARRHHAPHAVAGLERPADQVGLPEHAVEVQVEAGDEVARAEAEARRQDARAPLGVDDREVRRVTYVVGAVERAAEHEGALGRGEPAQAR